MKIFTSHLRDGGAPTLVQEGFSPAAAIFGVLWFLVQRAWIVAALDLAVCVLVTRLTALTDSLALPFAVVLAQGLFGRDLVRWNLSLRGYRPGPVVAALDHDSALARLVTERTELFPNLLRSLG